MTNYPEEVRKVLYEAGHDCPPHYDEPLRRTLDLDSLEMAEVVLLLEERWPALEDQIEMEDSVWHTGTVRQIAARIEQIVGAQAV